MQKSKHDFEVANQEISFGNVYMIQNGFTFFDRNSCLTFKLSTAITQWKKYTHRTLSLKNTTICFNWKEAIWSLTKKKEKKKEKLTESLHLTVKIASRSNYNIGLRNFAKTKSLPKPQSASKWKTYRLSAMRVLMGLPSSQLTTNFLANSQFATNFG